MLVMGVCRQVSIALVPGIVIAEHQLSGLIHVLEDVRQSFNGDFDVDELSKVKQGSVEKINIPAKKPFVAASLVEGQFGGLDERTGIEDLADSLEVGLNSQCGGSAR
jgi:hypothetical protein